MNGKKAKAKRRAEVPAPASTTGSFWTSWKGVAVGLVVAAVVGASFALPGAFDKKSSAERTGQGHAAMTADGDGLAVGSRVPAFAERNVETGTPITSQSLRDQKTLLFFSEGVMCQACFEQIKGLEQMQAELDKRGIRLVSITPDRPGDLRQAIAQYGIESPMIADDDGDMSQAFDTLGQGMHADTPGHAFALIDKGRMLWYRDYWLTPDRTMYVDPAQVLADLEA